MKLKKLFYCSMIGVLTLALFTGCSMSKVKNDLKTNLKKKAVEKSKGNCEAIECIKSIEPTTTIEEINKIIGFEGELKNETTKRYYWELTKKTGVEVTYSSNGKNSVSITIDKLAIANKKVDFSNYEEIKTLLKSGQSLTYDEFVSKVGGVEGTLIGKTPYSKRYIWVNSKGGYLNAYFSDSTGKCTLVSGRY